MIQPSFQGLSRSSPDGNARRMSTNLSRKPGIRRSETCGQQRPRGTHRPGKGRDPSPALSGPTVDRHLHSAPAKTRTLAASTTNATLANSNLLNATLLPVRSDAPTAGPTPQGHPAGTRSALGPPPVSGNVGRSQKWQDPLLTPFCQRPRPSMLTVCGQRATTPAIPFCITSVSLVERTVRS